MPRIPAASAAKYVEGFYPYWLDLKLSDLDNSFYANLTSPYPIDFPWPGFFESQTLQMKFWTAGGAVRLDLLAQIDSITAPYYFFGATVPDTGSSLSLLAASFGLLTLAARIAHLNRGLLHGIKLAALGRVR